MLKGAPNLSFGAVRIGEPSSLTKLGGESSYCGSRLSRSPASGRRRAYNVLSIQRLCRRLKFSAIVPHLSLTTNWQGLG
jgi:hypothetical protein